MSDKQARMMRHLHHIDDEVTAFEVGAARCYFWRGLQYPETSGMFAVERCRATVGGTLYVKPGIVGFDSKAADLVGSRRQFGKKRVKVVADLHAKADELAMAGSA